MTPKISIIILNWNGWKDTIECLESLYQINYSNFQVILLDNDSKDDSVEKIREYCHGDLFVESNYFKYSQDNKPISLNEIHNNEIEKKDYDDDDLILIKNDKNYGFAEGNNIGIDFVINNLKSDYILLLNNDTVVSSDFLDILVDSIEKEDDMGIIGPKVCYYDEPDKIQTEGWAINWNKGKEHLIEKQSNSLIDVDFIGGVALLFRKEVAEKVGLLNKDYFAYWEDADFCLRAKNDGYELFCNPKSKIWHKGSVSAEKVTGFNAYYNSRNRFWFMKTHATKNQYAMFKLYFFLYEFWISTAYFIINNYINEYSSYRDGIKDGLKYRG